MERQVNWDKALLELSKRLAKVEYLADKGRDYNTWVPNGVETTEIMVKASAIYSDVIERNSQ